MDFHNNILTALSDFGVCEQISGAYFAGDYTTRLINGKTYYCKTHKDSVFKTAMVNMTIAGVKHRVHNNHVIMDYLLKKLNEIFKTMLILDTTEIGIDIIYAVLVELYDKTLKDKAVSVEAEAEKPKKKTPKKVVTDDTEQVKPKKKTISQLMKRRVWAKHIGEDVGKHKCLCCEMTDITQLSFNCGHIVAESNGGELTVDNLLPICQSCNSSMGTQNLYDYKKAHGL